MEETEVINSIRVDCRPLLKQRIIDKIFEEFEADVITMTGDSKSSDNSCIFCRIVAGSAEAHRVYEDDLSLAIFDISPLAKGHCLVIPKRHVPWWHDLNEKETESLFTVARIVASRIMKAFKPDFVCMYAGGEGYLIPIYSSC